jgi:hypothetical protein
MITATLATAPQTAPAPALQSINPALLARNAAQVYAPMASVLA